MKMKLAIIILNLPPFILFGKRTNILTALLFGTFIISCDNNSDTTENAIAVNGKEYHVAKTGDNKNEGSSSSPLLTIQAAAELAQPGDVITVHEGIYRERVNPPRGGNSNVERIIYQAADSEVVIIKGSEVVKEWRHVSENTWIATIPNSFFGVFNPFNDTISGDWFMSNGRQHHAGAVYLNGHWLYEAAKLDEVMKPAEEKPLWFGKVDDKNTTIWAQFKDVDPNQKNIEVNARQTVFYPDEPGINYITVRGFILEHAATPWAPPTAEQIGLIGTHWSKGWVIENNTIRYSICSGITLGKYGDEFDNKARNSTKGYVETIERALKNGWSKENIGHHLIHNNHISHCEQAGIVGSLGGVFCVISGNEIHDIHMRRLYSGMEMGGIKIHGAIDVHISNNHIYRTWRGLWLDWMAQGARVTCNLFHDNEATQDLFVEVNHGPFLVDHNLFLSGNVLNDISNGGAYAHNLFTGRIIAWPNDRNTPYFKAHSTEIVGTAPFPGGDARYYNNIFVGQKDSVPWPDRIPKELNNQHYLGLATYDSLGQPSCMAGNVFLGQAKPSVLEKNPVTDPDIETGFKLEERNDGWYLQLPSNQSWLAQISPLVTTELLGKAKIPNLPFEKPDGTSIKLDTDYLGEKRNIDSPDPGPFVISQTENQWIKVWRKEKHYP